MLLAAVSFVGMNAGARFDPRFIKQYPQRLAVMAIGGSRLNRYHYFIGRLTLRLVFTVRGARIHMSSLKYHDAVRLYLFIDYRSSPSHAPVAVSRVLKRDNTE